MRVLWQIFCGEEQNAYNIRSIIRNLAPQHSHFTWTRWPNLQSLNNNNTCLLIPHVRMVCRVQIRRSNTLTKMRRSISTPSQPSQPAKPVRAKMCARPHRTDSKQPSSRALFGLFLGPLAVWAVVHNIAATNKLLLHWSAVRWCACIRACRCVYYSISNQPAAVR